MMAGPFAMPQTHTLIAQVEAIMDEQEAVGGVVGILACVVALPCVFSHCLPNDVM